MVPPSLSIDAPSVQRRPHSFSGYNLAKGAGDGNAAAQDAALDALLALLAAGDERTAAGCAPPGSAQQTAEQPAPLGTVVGNATTAHAV